MAMLITLLTLARLLLCLPNVYLNFNYIFFGGLCKAIFCSNTPIPSPACWSIPTPTAILKKLQKIRGSTLRTGDQNIKKKAPFEPTKPLKNSLNSGNKFSSSCNQQQKTFFCLCLWVGSDCFLSFVNFGWQCQSLALSRLLMRMSC